MPPALKLAGTLTAYVPLLVPPKIAASAVVEDVHIEPAVPLPVVLHSVELTSQFPLVGVLAVPVAPTQYKFTGAAKAGVTNVKINRASASIRVGVSRIFIPVACWIRGLILMLDWVFMGFVAGFVW